MQIRALTRAEAQAIYAAGEETVIEFIMVVTEQLAALQARVTELEDQLAKHSGNSGKPPSSDGLGKPAPKSQRKKTGRKPGGQRGHEGHTAKRSATPDIVVEHRPLDCEHCGRSLAEHPGEVAQTRQVRDIPEPRMEITEHRRVTVTCPHCDTTQSGVFPANVNAPVQYGPRIRALMSALNTRHAMSYSRVAELTEDLFGDAAPSMATAANTVERAANAAAPETEKIRQALCEADVVHFDETGLRVESKLRWLHSASTARLTYCMPHEKRGTDAMDAMGVLPVFQGVAVHDHWKPYFRYDCLHALCNAHILRELQFIAERTGQVWAEGMSEVLRIALRFVYNAHAQKEPRLSDTAHAFINDTYDQLIDMGLAQNPMPPRKHKKGRAPKGKTRSLLERLRDHKSQVLAFLEDFRVPFDNNQAERDIRPSKTKLKVAGSFRAMHGAKFYAHLHSYICTARKNNHNPFHALVSLLDPRAAPLNVCIPAE